MLEGNVEPAFRPVAQHFEEQVAGGGGAALAVYHEGRPVVDLWGGLADPATGAHWREDTIVMAFSTTKGVAATALHLCVDRGLLDYDDRVAQHWPGFAAAGKDEVTVRQVLCHEAGLYDVESLLARPDDLFDWEAMVEALERAEPAFVPGSANAYHAVTFGFLVGELVRRVTGTGIADFVASEIAAPLGLDGAFLATPDEALHRVATLQEAEGLTNILGEGGGEGRRERPSEMVELARSMDLAIHPEITRRAFGAAKLREAAGSPDALRYPVPSFNGTFDARSLARLYATLAAGGTLDGVRLLSPEAIARATEIQNRRPDLAIVFPMRWRLGYHGVLTTAGAPERAFGHNGLGGSGAWGDPDRALALAMVTNRLGANPVADGRLMALGGAALSVVG